jgi:putative membrane protein
MAKLHLSLLGLVIAGFVWSVIDPVDLTTWAMEIAPVVIVLPLLAFTYHSFRLTNLLYVLIACHALILIVGAHYTYAHVPLFDTIRDMVGGTRNSYDGVGHFAQGFIPAIATREILLRKSGIHSGFLLSLIIVLACLGISAVYEIIEWIVAIIMGQGADEFLGTQGDVWDTQKDMALAGVGALCAVLFLSKIHDIQLGKLGGE